MNKFLRVPAIATLITLCAVIGLPTTALAAKPTGSGPSRTATLTGNDISWPQCGKTLPRGQAFAVVGINSGVANNFNSCFSSEYAWAQTSVGGTKQAPVQLYVNTGNPGDVLAQYNVADWPTSSAAADPYGTCSGTWTDNMACSWEYGYERAQADLSFVGSSTANNWWLDIETSNSWTSDYAKNQASLEGMTYALQQAGKTVGIYASSGSWSSLFGSVAPGSTLYSLNEWRPGAKTLSKAQSDCSLAPFEGNGQVVITQYVSAQLDYDYSCV